MPPSVAAQKYPHGTRARYALGKCRCFECKVANADYAMERAEELRAPYTMHYSPSGKVYIVRCRATGTVVFRNPMKSVAARYRDRLNKREAPESERTLVDAKAARRHIETLRARGIGTRTIATRAGLNHGVVKRIATGEIQKTRRETEQKILGVAPVRASGSLVDAATTWAMLEKLFAAGYTKSAISKMLGHKTRGLGIRSDTVLRATEIAVEKLFWALWLKDAKVRAVSPQAPKGLVLPAVDPAAAARRKLAAMDVNAFAEGLSRLLAS